MNLEFEKTRHEKLANDFQRLSRKYGVETAEDITIGLDVLRAAPSLADIPKKPFRPHPMKGRAKGSFTIDVDRVNRILFHPYDIPESPPFRIDDFRSIISICIEEICIKIH